MDPPRALCARGCHLALAAGTGTLPGALILYRLEISQSRNHPAGGFQLRALHLVHLECTDCSRFPRVASLRS